MKTDDAVPIQIVSESDAPESAVVAMRRVNELDFYNLGLRQLAQHVDLTAPRTLAVVRALDLQSNADYYKRIRIGTAEYKRYSQKAIDRIKAEVPALDMEAVWEEHGPRRH